MFSQEFFVKIIFLHFEDYTDSTYILTTLPHVLLFEKILLVDFVPNTPLIAAHICKKAFMYISYMHQSIVHG